MRFEILPFPYHVKFLSPPNSPNLNPYIYLVWGAMHEAFLKSSIISELNVALEKTWENFPQNKAVPRFRKKLGECIKIFEHLL